MKKQSAMTQNRFKLQVNSFAPGTLSHQLYIYCNINGKPSKEQIRKTVNYYRFKEYVENEMRVTNFNNWYFDNKYSVSFLFALEAFINKTEGRNTYYSPIAAQISKSYQKIEQRINTNYEIINQIFANL